MRSPVSETTTRVAPSGVVVSLRRLGSRHGDKLLLAAVVALALSLRMWDLGRIGFRGDEAVYAGQAAVLADISPMDRYFVLISRGNSNFLAYQWVVSVLYRFLGVSDVAARMVAAGFSTLTVVVTYATARSLYGHGKALRERWTPLYAALFLTVSGYAVALGRLALLDSMLVFLFALSLFFVAKWTETGRHGWLYGFAAVAALTVQTKVVGVLVFAIFGAYLLVTQAMRFLHPRTVLIGGLVFAAVFTPVALQLATNGGQFLDLLAGSSQRASKSPWYYYIRTVAGYDGLVLVCIWGVAIAAAIKRRRRADLLPGLWVLVVVGFYQLYPLKGFNYLLPAMPALALLAARWLSSLSPALVTRAAAVGLAAALVVATAPTLHHRLHDESSAGLREAARWLEENTPADAGVMTLSNGSAQYVMSIYGKRDAYPFGRFRLATVLPGGHVVAPRPTQDGTPRDWVTFQPKNLIEGGTVSYLVYNTRPLDDPPEDGQFVQSSVQRGFRDLVERYGGELMHTVYRNHEGRAYVYKLTRVLPKPVISYSVAGGLVTLEGRGFKKGAEVTVMYLRDRVAGGTADGEGSLSVTFPLPPRVHPSYQLVAVDDAGNHASITDLDPGES